MDKLELTTSTDEKSYPNFESYIISTDDEAQKIIANAKNNFILQDDALQLFEVAERVSRLHSFTGNQTYPRPSHPYEEMRKSPYFTLAGIVISLRCTLSTEMKVTRMLMQAAPDDKALFSLTAQEIAEIIKPAGFADRKAGWIVGGLRKLTYDNALSIDVLSHDNLDVARTKMLSLPGFGPKAADCFLLTGLNRASFPVDVNVFNLVTRLFPYVINASPNFSSPRQVTLVKSFLERTIPSDVKLYQIMHTYLLLATKHKVN